MDFWQVLGAVSGVASIVGLALPLTTRHQRVVHLLYGLAIVALSSTAVWYWSQNNRLRSVERTASVLVAERQMGYTNEGFIQAALAFLEKNKDLYPEAYARAQKLCEVNSCLTLNHSIESVDLAFALEGLLKGIGTLEGRP